MSVSHWSDQAVGLAELARVMAPDAILVAADIRAARSVPAVTGSWRGESGRPGGLPGLIRAVGLRVEYAEPIRSVAAVADAVLVAASKRGSRRRRCRAARFGVLGNNWLCRM